MAREITAFSFSNVSEQTIDNILDELEEKETLNQISRQDFCPSPRVAKEETFLPYYFNDINKFTDGWSINNRNGFIQLLISENCLCSDLLAPKIKESQSKIEITNDTLYYMPGCYFAGLQKCLSEFVDTYIMSPENSYSLNPDHIIIGAGLTNMFPILMYVMCKPKDIVLVPSPFFSGFHMDLQILGTNIQLIPIPTSASNNYDVELYQLNKLYAKYGKKIRAFLFTSPNNPTGKVYDKSQIELMYLWCQERHIHFIADEIYALSANTPHSAFVSCLDVVENIADTRYFHWIYGISKDFCLSGLRIGFFYTENEHIRDGVRKYHFQYNVPFHTQQLVYHILSDKKWVKYFLSENKKRLIAKYNLWTKGLSKYNIKYFNAENGLYVWINLSEWFNKIWKQLNQNNKIYKNGLNGLNAYVYDKIEKLFEWEKLFYYELVKNKKLSIAPGRCFGTTQPGFYRICFAMFTSDTVILDSLERLHDMLNVEQFIKRIVKSQRLH